MKHAEREQRRRSKAENLTENEETVGFGTGYFPVGVVECFLLRPDLAVSLR